MTFPSLVPKSICKTPIQVTLHLEDIDENGAPKSIELGQLHCNYQDRGTHVFTDKTKDTKVGGRAYFNGDIAIDIANITSGKVIVNGHQRNIVSGTKARNPDGSVNYTQIDLE